MNLGVLEHIAITLILITLGFLTGYFTDYPIAGAIVGYALGSGVFIGREHDQNEVRWCNKFNGGHRAGAPWNCGFRLVTMDLHSYLGFLGPIVVGGLYVVLAFYVKKLIN